MFLINSFLVWDVSGSVLSKIIGDGCLFIALSGWLVDVGDEEICDLNDEEFFIPSNVTINWWVVGGSIFSLLKHKNNNNK